MSGKEQERWVWDHTLTPVKQKIFNQNEMECKRNFQKSETTIEIGSEPLPVQGLPRASGPKTWQPSFLWPEGKKKPEHPGALSKEGSLWPYWKWLHVLSLVRKNHLVWWEESCMPKQRLRPQSPKAKESLVLEEDGKRPKTNFLKIASFPGLWGWSKPQRD